MSMTDGIRSPEAMKAEIEGLEKSVTGDDHRLSREFTFDLHYTDRRGKVWDGRFTNQALNFTQIAQVGALMARMQGGLPNASFDEFTLDHNEKISHLTVSLTKRPKWAADLGDLFDKDLLDEIYKEVSLHEATFSGRRSPKADSDEGSEDDEG